MAIIKSTQYILPFVAIFLFVVSVMLTVIAGVGLRISFIWNLLSSLYIYYDLIPTSIASTSSLILIASLLDAFVFALFAVFLATWFINLLRRINIREYLSVSRAKKLKNHIIVVPYNNFSKALIDELSNDKLKTVLIAEKESEASRVNEKGVFSIVGDIKDKGVFMTAGIERASYLIACDDEDVKNALIAITAKDANPKIKVISRVVHEENMQKLGKAGAYRIVLPGVTAGMAIGEEIARRTIQ